MTLPSIVQQSNATLLTKITLLVGVGVGVDVTVGVLVGVGVDVGHKTSG